MDPNGPCQVITKERLIDDRIGEYEDVNEAVKKLSQGALEEVSLYSIMEKPMIFLIMFRSSSSVVKPIPNRIMAAISS